MLELHDSDLVFTLHDEEHNTNTRLWYCCCVFLSRATSCVARAVIRSIVQTFHHGIPLDSQLISYDPVQRLLAVSGRNGRVKLYPHRLRSLCL